MQILITWMELICVHANVLDRIFNFISRKDQSASTSLVTRINFYFQPQWAMISLN